MEDQYQDKQLDVSDRLQSISNLNQPVHDKKNEIETRIGKVIGLENAAIKILRQIASVNKKRQEFELPKNIDTKIHLNFKRQKTQKLLDQSLYNQDYEINNNKIDRIANETEKTALMILGHYLFDMEKAEDNCTASKSVKFLCLSHDGRPMQHDCCYFY